MRWFMLLVCMMLSVSCALPKFEAGEAVRYFSLGDLSFQAKTENKSDRTILINETQASTFLASSKIAFKRDTFEHGYYQFANWSEPPSRRITNLILARLAAEGIYRNVSLLSGSTVGDFQLNTTLLSFEQDLTVSPSVATVVLRAELVNALNRQVVAQRTFTDKQNIGRSNVEAAVNAFNIAIDRVLDELVGWLSLQQKEDNKVVEINSEP